MQVKKDDYRKEMVEIMLTHETNPEETHYAGHLSHWYGDSKPINVEADMLSVMAKAYAGEYVEVNEPVTTIQTDIPYKFWDDGNDPDENDWTPLLFVRLTDLSNLSVVRLLQKFDCFYGDTNQDTEDWALEYQLLTRMLVNGRYLLVNPTLLDISDENTMSEILEELSEDDRAIYLAARAMTPEQIKKEYRDSLR